MPFRFLDDLATADVAFCAWDKTCEGLFLSAAEATLSVLMKDVEALCFHEAKPVCVRSPQRDLLLLKFLEEILFLKDAEGLLLRPDNIQMACVHGEHILQACLRGERIDPEKHQFLVDVKAVTLHHLKVEQTDTGWQATVVLDI